MSDRIGTVELLKVRVYKLDAEAHDRNASTVVVEPGVYDLYRDGMATFWLMRGKLNRRGFWRLGDGAFRLYQSDEVSDVEVVFPSRRFGPDEWAHLLSGPKCTEGHEGQRLRVSLLATTEAVPNA